MAHPFDTLSLDQLRQESSVKWQHYDKDVLPLWVADMDFPIAKPIQDALHTHVKKGYFGYAPMEGIPQLKESLIDRLYARYNWQVEPEDIYPINGIVPGLFLSVMACSSRADEVLMHSPIYAPFMMAVNNLGRRAIYNQLRHDGEHWQMDMASLDKDISPASRLFMLCNPQNPVGRVFQREELEQLAECVLKHRLWLLSDELHSELIFSGQRHIPIASLSKEIAERTITLLGPTKTFSIAGFKIGFIICQNKALMQHLQNRALGLMGPPNVLAQAACIAAYKEGDPWLQNTLNYLEESRDFITEFIKHNLPSLGFSPPQGTYLAWLDFSHYALKDKGFKSPSDFLLKEAKLALNDGAWFGPGGDSFARLNFATSRHLVERALGNIKTALESL